MRGDRTHGPTKPLFGAFPPEPTPAKKSASSKRRKLSKKRTPVPPTQVAPLAADSIARSKKIERIRKAVADGSYQVSASEVADKVLDYMLGR